MSCHPNVNFLSLCGASVQHSLHLADNRMTTAIRGLPNLPSWDLAAGNRIKRAGLITDSGGVRTCHDTSLV